MITLVRYCAALYLNDPEYADPYNQNKCSINKNIIEGPSFRKCSTSKMLPKNTNVPCINSIN